MIALAALVASAGCPGPGASTSLRLPGCGKDTDCKGRRVCVAQQCVEPHLAAAAGPDGGPASASAPHAPGAPPLAMYKGNAQHTGVLAGPAPAVQPQLMWTIKTGGPIVGSPTVGADGTIYVGSHDGKLYAVSPAGQVRWTFATGDRIWSTPAVAQDGTVYVGSDDDHLYAVDGKTGAQKWRFRIGQCDSSAFGPEGVRCDADGGPTLGPDGTIYLGGDGVYAVWPDGTLRWKLATPQHVSVAPALAPDGTVYAACQDNALYAVRPDGTKAWELRIDDDIDSAPVVAPDGTIYVGATTARSTRSRPTAASSGRCGPAATCARRRRSHPTAPCTSAPTTTTSTRSRPPARSSGASTPPTRSTGLPRSRPAAPS